MKTDRDFYFTIDSAFKITLFLKKYPRLNTGVKFLSNLSVRMIRKLRKKKRSKPRSKILIITLHRIGDTVFSIPAIKDIIEYHKNDEVKILCFEDTKPILEEVFVSDMLIGLLKHDLKFQRKFPGRKTREQVTNIDPTVIYDLTGMPLSASLILLTRAEYVYGRNIEYLKSIYDRFTPLRETPHFFDYYYDVVRDSIPVEYQNQNFEFPVAQKKSGKIIIHPFGIRHAKEWNLRKYIELGDRLAERFNVIIVSPPGFIKEDIKNEINKLKNVELNITGDLAELISVIKSSSLYIGNDSGPTYIASFLGVPTFTVYGPTNPDFSLPNGEFHSYIIKRLKCSARDEKVCETLGGIYCPSNECMQIIEVEEVEREVDKFIEKIGLNNLNEKQ